MRDLTNNIFLYFRRSRQGNLLIVLPIAICLLTAAFGISAFLNLSNFNLKRVVLKQKSHEVSEKIRAKVRDMIQTNKTCNGYDFSILKDASTLPVAPFVFDKTKLVPCFISVEEAAMFKSISLTVTRISRANDSALAQTMIQTQYKSETDSSPIFLESVNRQIIVSLVTPMSFAAIFRGSGNIVDLSDKGTLVVSGKTLISNGTGDGVNLDSFVNPPILVKREGEVLFEDIVYQTARSVTTQEYFNIDSLLYSFRGGIQENSFSGLNIAFGVGSNEAFWNQPLDYYYVYNDSGGYPLPASIPNSAIGPFGYKPIDLDRAQLNAFPDGVVLKKLSQTCEMYGSSSEGSVKPMIYLNKNKDLSLNFNNSNVFCGFIIANVLEIKIPDEAEVAIYGHVNVSKIKIEGNGKLYIVNPYDFKSSPQGAVLPSSASIQSLVPVLDSLKTTVAHNFFVPIGNASTSFAPESIANHFEACGTSKCWKSYVQSSDISKLYVSNWYKNLKMLVIEAL